MVLLQPQHYSSHRPGVIARLADSLSLTCRLAPRRCEMVVGFAFSNFKDVEVALGKLKKEQYHPLRVYNSQSAADYNKKRANAKNPPLPVDTVQLQRAMCALQRYAAESR